MHLVSVLAPQPRPPHAAVDLGHLVYYSSPLIRQKLFSFIRLHDAPLLGNCETTMLLLDHAEWTTGHEMEPGHPHFLISHIGPFHRTRFPTVAQIMARTHNEGPHAYMGRFSFRLRSADTALSTPDPGDRLPLGEWTALPAEVSSILIPMHTALARS